MDGSFLRTTAGRRSSYRQSDDTRIKTVIKFFSANFRSPRPDANSRLRYGNGRVPGRPILSQIGGQVGATAAHVFRSKAPFLDILEEEAQVNARIVWPGF